MAPGLLAGFVEFLHYGRDFLVAGAGPGAATLLGGVLLSQSLGRARLACGLLVAVSCDSLVVAVILLRFV